MSPHNCISLWYPVLRDVVATPDTRIVTLSGHLDPSSNDPSAATLDLECMRMLGGACLRLQELPVMIRSGHCTRGEQWRNASLIEDVADVLNHAHRIAFIARLQGLPTNVWAARRLVDARPLSKSYDGLPICREWRTFVDRSEVIRTIPRWTREKIMAGRPVNDELLDQFDAYFELTPEQLVVIERAAGAAGMAMAAASGEPLWAVDTIEDRHGSTWVIDVQTASGAWGWEQSLGGYTDVRRDTVETAD